MPNVLWTLPHSKGLTEKKIIFKKLVYLTLLNAKLQTKYIESHINNSNRTIGFFKVSIIDSPDKHHYIINA